MICNSYKECPFEISGVSYVGAPVPGTAMYASKKIQKMLEKLSGTRQCLVFVETGSVIPDDAERDNCFVISDTPQRDYAVFASELSANLFAIEKSKPYRLTDGGFYIGEDTQISEDAYIEPGCLIGHGVKIGKNAVIRANSVIKHAVIGDDFICNEGAVIGSDGFTMIDDADGNKMRIPTFGIVEIGNSVEIGPNNNINRGSAGSTVIEDHVKLDSLVHVGHDSHICKNVEITAGVAIGGYVTVGEGVFFGLNSTVKNRIKVGGGSLVGIGSSVVLPVKSGTTVLGQIAKPFKAFEGGNS